MFYLAGVWLGDNVVNSLTNGLQGVGLVVRDLDVELVLDLHDDLHNIQRVQTKVSDEIGGLTDVFACDFIVAFQQLDDSFSGDLSCQGGEASIGSSGDVKLWECKFGKFGNALGSQSGVWSSQASGKSSSKHGGVWCL